MIPHTTQNWQISKPAARGKGGIVVSQVKVAAEAGAEMLRAGGTAADAAGPPPLLLPPLEPWDCGPRGCRLAPAFVLATLEPWNCGLGGVGFAQAMKPGMAVAETFDFGPVAPSRLDASAFPLTGRQKQDLFTWPEVVDDRNIHGPLSFVIPSA